ncbi:hypothetical protein J2Y55_001886 [Bosea sp. BE125]|uniref:hypothetical protein n=1 Tax=Bosea sp. BE125 TaxID=2817909 RepID=UPI00285D7081|nr:hypothetical protein [Bosea sp. BE125]MDR6870878.1 hypothetical protein [Bosea sp. BE125]
MSALTTSQAQAGLLEMLFGGPAPQRQEIAPLEMTIRPTKKAKPKVPRVSMDDDGDSKRFLQVSIDPVSNPDWYLTDPTLRRGDIVVLSNKVLVYAGGRSTRRLADFDDLQGTRLVSSRDRERIKLLTEFSGRAMPKFKIVPEFASSPASLSAQAERKVNVIMP